ncbi:MAG: HNH endonuclease [Patescibacteria group bacterium]|nr:HNH endonuclease [Patescibacteria group bacterium]
MLLDHKHLLEWLHYDPETGIWTWLKSRPYVKAGQRADVPKDKKYRRIWIRGKLYYTHRLAWFYMHGEWPACPIDHKNLNGWDNSWNNLRLATYKQNGANRSLNKNNTTGVKGVYWNKTKKKWQAYICINYKSKYLGRFNTLRDAIKCRQKFAELFFGEFARHA